MPRKQMPAAELAAKKELALEVIERLKAEYPDAACTLDYADAWQLLVSVRLAHRGHRQALRPGPLQGAGHLCLYARAAGQIRLPGAHHL